MTKSSVLPLSPSPLPTKGTLIPFAVAQAKGTSTAGKKQLKKVEAQAQAALEKHNEGDDIEHVKTELSQDPNLENYEFVKMAFLGIPLMMTGICGPVFMALTSDIALPDSADTIGLCLAMGSAIGMMASNKMLWEGRMLKHQLKYTLGQKVPRHKIKSLRAMQKTLGLSKRITLPADAVFDNPAINAVAKEKGMELNLVIGPRSMRLQWTKPLPTAALWDQAMDNLVEVFNLEGNAQEKEQLSQSFTRQMVINLSQNA